MNIKCKFVMNFNGHEGIVSITGKSLANVTPNGIKKTDALIFHVFFVDDVMW
jgi:hypothetical protein